jgi:hypothetical protein
MAFRSRSLFFARVLVVAALGIALSAQLVQAQLLIHCSEAGAAVEMLHDDHAGHHSTTGEPGTDVRTAPDDKSSDGCGMRGMCSTAPAVPELPEAIGTIPPAAPITAPGAATPHDLALRPDFPPPRL